MSLTLPASRQVIKCFLSKVWLGVRMPQSQPTEIKHRTLGSWGGTAWGGGLCGFLQGDHRSSPPPAGLGGDSRVWRLSDCKARSWWSQWCPALSPPPTKAASGSRQLAGGRGRRRRLPAALFPAGRGVAFGQPGTETADHGPCPPTSPPSAEASRGLGGSPRPSQGGSSGSQTAPARPVREGGRRAAGAGRKERASRATAQRPRRPGTNIALCGGCEGQGGARGAAEDGRTRPG